MSEETVGRSPGAVQIFALLLGQLKGTARVGLNAKILACVLPILLNACGSIAAAPPNVVLILSDDQAWQDYGFMGSQEVQTPHLDQLAQRSLLFERGYVVSSLCRPSLASVVTGLYPHQHGVLANDVSPASGPERQRENQPVFEKFHSKSSWVRLLAANGYEVFQSGKWWEGSWQDGGFTAGMTHGDHLRGGRHGDEGLTIGRAGMQPVAQFIDEAVAAEKPFCVWYAPLLPHTPHNPPDELLVKYTAEGRPENVAKYYAMCEWFDNTCGELLTLLDERQLTRNTLVVFLADNGWAARIDDGELPDGWWSEYAPRSKGSPYEAGLRTPIMLSWPAKIAAERAPQLASSLDLMPTILTACGIKPPANLPGIDLLDTAARGQRDTVFGAIYSTHNMTPGDPASTLQYRWGIHDRWKLMLRSLGSDTTRYITLHNWDLAPVQLFDLQRDPHEHQDVAAEWPELVRDLQAKIEHEIPHHETQPSVP